MFNQKEKRGFIWAKNIDLLRKKSCSLKEAVRNFKNIRRKTFSFLKIFEN